MAANMPVHRAANLFPMMNDKELAELAADIKAHCLRQPILLDEGQHLDGRNRLAACRIAGIEPCCQEVNLNGDSPTLFTVAESLSATPDDLTARCSGC